MVLIDTNVISESRTKDKANQGVVAFLSQVAAQEDALHLSVGTVGEGPMQCRGGASDSDRR